MKELFLLFLGLVPMALGVIGGPARLATNPVDDPPAPPPEQREPPIIQCSTVPKDEEGVITSLAFHPGGNTLAACNDHGMAKYFDVASAHQTRAFRVQERRWGGLRALLFTPDGAILFAGVYFQKAPAVLDAATGRDRLKLEEPKVDVRLGINAMACSADGTILAAGFGSGEIALWDVATGRLRAVLPAHIIPAHTSGPLAKHVLAQPAWIVHLAFSPDGSTLASDDTTAVRFWDVATGKPKAGAPVIDGRGCLAFSPDGKTLAVAESTMRVDEKFHYPIRLWDLATGRKRVEMTAQWAVSGLAFLPGGWTLVTLDGGRTVRLWDAESGRAQAGLRFEHHCVVQSLAVSPDGKMIAAGGYESDPMFGVIQLVDVDGMNLRQRKSRP